MTIDSGGVCRMSHYQFRENHVDIRVVKLLRNSGDDTVMFVGVSGMQAENDLTRRKSNSAINRVVHAEVSLR